MRTIVPRPWAGGIVGLFFLLGTVNRKEIQRCGGDGEKKPRLEVLNNPQKVWLALWPSDEPSILGPSQIAPLYLGGPSCHGQDSLG